VKGKVMWMSKMSIVLSEQSLALAKEILSKLLLLMSEDRLPPTAKSNLKNLKRVLNGIDKALRELEIKHDINE